MGTMRELRPSAAHTACRRDDAVLGTVRLVSGARRARCSLHAAAKPSVVVIVKPIVGVPVRDDSVVRAFNALGWYFGLPVFHASLFGESVAQSIGRSYSVQRGFWKLDKCRTLE
jgi:hypothetical protein